MNASATLEPGRSPEAAHRLVLDGEWTLANAAPLAAQLDALLPRARFAPIEVDAHGVSRLDTTGALLILRALDAAAVQADAIESAGLGAGSAALLRLVAQRNAAPAGRVTRHGPIAALLERIGASVLGILTQGRTLLGFIGLTWVTLVQIPLGRRKLRATATVFHMEQVGLDAVPIVALLTFLVGAVVAFVGATALRDFGAEVFTVELVSISFLREFAVLLTAILLAGRSGSAFTAQIGSMKSREEIDAIRALGLDPIELLVVPRLVALGVTLPLLTFVAMVCGILGGGLVAVYALDITPGMFVSRLQEMTDVRHFWVGMVKAPVFAFLIAVVGCLEGFKVEGSAESVGRHTTSSVVQSIFLVIVVDALFAMFYLELDV